MDLWGWIVTEMMAVAEWRSGDEIAYFEVFETTWKSEGESCCR